MAASAAAWPFAVRAQVSPKRRVGFLTPSNHCPVVAGRIAAFRSGLAPAGSAEAADAEVVVRAANNQIDKLPALAVDLVGQGVQAIYLPIERPTRFKLVANLKTASALGLTLPTPILLSADEAIE